MGTNKEASCSLFLHNFLSQPSEFEKYYNRVETHSCMSVYVCVHALISAHTQLERVRRSKILTVDKMSV